SGAASTQEVWREHHRDLPSGPHELERPPDLPGSIEVASWLTGQGGRRLSPRAAASFVINVPQPVLPSLPRARAWVATRHISFWIGYQPASRYWLFQSAVAGILLALA